MSNSVPKKKTQIINTSMDLFLKFGMKRVTVEEICSTAKVSKMTFYKYFPNKIELVKHLLDTISEMIVSKISELRKLNISFTDKINLWIEFRLEITSKYSKEFIDEFFNADEKLATFINQMNKNNFTHFVKFITDAQKTGEVRQDIIPEFIPFVLDNLYGLVKNDDVNRLYPDILKLTRELNNFFFYGIMARP